MIFFPYNIRQYHRAWPKFSLFHSWALKINVEQKRWCWHCRGMAGISGSKVRNRWTFLLFPRGLFYYFFLFYFSWVFPTIKILYIRPTLLNLFFSSLSPFFSASDDFLFCFFHNFFFWQFWNSLPFEFLIILKKFIKFDLMNRFSRIFIFSIFYFVCLSVVCQFIDLTEFFRSFNPKHSSLTICFAPFILST